MAEYVSEKHRELVARYREAEQRAAATVWPERPQALNRIVVFDLRPRPRD